MVESSDVSSERLKLGWIDSYRFASVGETDSRLEIQIDMASTSERIDIERTKKTAEHVFDVLGGNETAGGSAPMARGHRQRTAVVRVRSVGNNRALLGKARARFRMSVEMLFNNSQNDSPSARRFAMCLDKKVFRGL
jgi:hypothetical protein